ncbi:UNVERIFIED_CONTAM: hypothetical protein Sindi_0350300 [Sesamum indicum]
MLEFQLPSLFYVKKISVSRKTGSRSCQLKYRYRLGPGIGIYFKNAIQEIFLDPGPGVGRDLLV